MSLSSAHAAAKNHLYSLERLPGQKFFPEPGQVMYAPQLQQALIEDPQAAINKIGFFMLGKEGETSCTYIAEMQCLLTYPESQTDDQYISDLEHSDDFLAAVNNTIIPGVGMLTRASGPSPMPEQGFLGIRIDFKVTSITI